MDYETLHTAAAPSIVPELPGDAPEAPAETPAELSANISTAPKQLKPGSIRARVSRQRRRDDMLCVRDLEMRGYERDALIKRGHLEAASRDDAAALKRALYSLFDSIF